MEYNEVDQYVDQLFREKNPVKSNLVLHDPILTGNLRNRPIDQLDEMNTILQNSLAEIMRRRNKQNPVGGDPRNGLNDLTELSWDEPFDAGQAAWDEANESSFAYEDENWEGFSSQTRDSRDAPIRGLTCAEWMLIAAIGLGLVLFMMIKA